MKCDKYSKRFNEFLPRKMDVAIYDSEESAKEQITSLKKTLEKGELSKERKQSNESAYFMGNYNTKNIEFSIKRFKLKLNN